MYPIDVYFVTHANNHSGPYRAYLSCLWSQKSPLWETVWQVPLWGFQSGTHSLILPCKRQSAEREHEIRHAFCLYINSVEFGFNSDAGTILGWSDNIYFCLFKSCKNIQNSPVFNSHLDIHLCCLWNWTAHLHSPTTGHRVVDYKTVYLMRAYLITEVCHVICEAINMLVQYHFNS